MAISGPSIDIDKDNVVNGTTFDNKYIIYKNTPGLKGNINNNLTDSFRASGIPLSARLTGSFTIDSISKTMSWTGRLTLTPTDSYCTYLKCKSGDNSVQYFYAQNGKFNLGSSGQIGVAEFGFGMEKIRTYQWNDAISPVDLLLFENEGVSHPEGTGRLVFDIVKENGFEYDKTYYESFRVDNQWVGNFQPRKKWRIGDFGYKTKDDDEKTDPYVAPFFNFGKATLISTNLYNRNSPPLIYSTKSGVVTINNITYNSDECDILLYFTPSLDQLVSPICPRCKLTAPVDGVGAYRPYYRNYFPGRPDGKDGNNWPQYSEASYQIGFTTDTEASETTFTYDKGQCYKLDWNQQTGSFTWNSTKWTPISSIVPDDFLIFGDDSVEGGIPSYYEEIKNFLSWAGESYMNQIDYFLNENRVLVYYSTNFASSCMSFKIKLKNVPSFKHDTYEHNKGCSIDEGRLSGYSSGDDNFYTDYGYILWTDSRHLLNPDQMHSVGPTIDLGEQTIYRNKQEIFDGEFSSGVSSSEDNMWGDDSMTVKFTRDTFSDGFYCLFAFPKGVL